MYGVTGMNNMKGYEEIVSLINKWGIDRGITKENGGSSQKQAIKMAEELDEFSDAVYEGNRIEVKDAIGDMFVVLVQMARLEDINLLEAINAAYDEIKDRKGKMINGIFVKEKTS